MTVATEARFQPAPEGLARGVAIVADALASARRSLDRVHDDARTHAAIAEAGLLMVEVLRAGGRILACGNGGSMCDAMHFAEELTGNFRSPREPLAAMALGDAGHLTCVGNDMGFDQVFSRAVTAWGREGDLLLALSTSGRSANVVAAAQAAVAAGMRVVALTGRPGAPLGELADVEVVTDSGEPWADRVQEVHGVVLHMWVEIIEAELFG